MPQHRSHPHDADLPIDPDAADRPDGPAEPAGPPASAATMSRLLGVIALGGVLGSLARHGLSQAFPTAFGHLPWATFLANVSGSLLLGLLLVLLGEVLAPSRYLRAFLGVGVLGGYTTFSTYTSDVRALLAAGHGPVALGYLFGTVAACLLATLAGIRFGRLVETRSR
jgi:CrcB protein